MGRVYGGVKGDARSSDYGLIVSRPLSRKPGGHLEGQEDLVSILLSLSHHCDPLIPPKCRCVSEGPPAEVLNSQPSDPARNEQVIVVVAPVAAVS